jgi:hypothetical protein
MLREGEERINDAQREGTMRNQWQQGVQKLFSQGELEFLGEKTY